MKKILLSILMVLLFANLVSAKTIIVPIEGEINTAKSNFVKDSLKDLSENDTVILKIDTYGGSVVAAEQIKNSIFNTSAKTISVVDNKAESAGVLITISSDKVYMVEGATIGSAEPIPNTEKTLSYWRSILADTAQRKGRDENIIVSMADSDVQIEGVVEKGKLLNLNSQKSKELGIADEVVLNFNEALEKENLKDAEMINMSLQNKFIDIISSQSISSLLLIIGMGAMAIELFMPGFGVGGILSIIAFGLFFIGNIIAGNATWYAIAVFILGLILVLIEIMMPGFGIAGISGIIALVTGIIFAMGSLEIAVKSLSMAIIVTVLLVIFMIKKGMKSPIFTKLMLDNTLNSGEGFLSVDNAMLQVGDICITKTVMKPTGYIYYDNKQYEAISVDGYIEKDVEVEVCKVEKSKIYIRRKINVF